MQVCWNR